MLEFEDVIIVIFEWIGFLSGCFGKWFIWCYLLEEIKDCVVKKKNRIIYRELWCFRIIKVLLIIGEREYLRFLLFSVKV